jgi:hypothetical protein
VSILDDEVGAMSCHPADAQALAAGQYVTCAICGQWVGPGDLHRLTIEDAVMCWPVIEALDVRATLTAVDAGQAIHAQCVVDSSSFRASSRRARSRSVQLLCIALGRQPGRLDDQGMPGYNRPGPARKRL